MRKQLGKKGLVEPRRGKEGKSVIDIGYGFQLLVISLHHFSASFAEQNLQAHVD